MSVEIDRVWELLAVEVYGLDPEDHEADCPGLDFASGSRRAGPGPHVRLSAKVVADVLAFAAQQPQRAAQLVAMIDGHEERKLLVLDESALRNALTPARVYVDERYIDLVGLKPLVVDEEVEAVSDARAGLARAVALLNREGEPVDELTEAMLHHAGLP